ncbi:MAG: nucleotidyltransferase domain-containing protein [Firmicutes bacterium]|nr:nucleotidyltransferase domain-containing protein [Bacillota bacterium]
MDKTTALKIARLYADEVIKELNPAKILLFGSYVKGSAREESDIDIAVIYDGFSGDWLRVGAKLASLTWKVSAYIEPVLLDSKNDRSGFVEEVLRTGEVVYQCK